jgi:hypothetical protein
VAGKQSQHRHEGGAMGVRRYRSITLTR